jgi:hypothetical protein
MIRRIIILGLLALVCSSCSGLVPTRDTLKTVDRLAKLACELFSADHPEEFAQMVRVVGTPETVAKLDASLEIQNDPDRMGLSIADICIAKEVIQPFIDDQLRLSGSMASAIRSRSETTPSPSGSDDADPPK